VFEPDSDITEICKLLQLRPVNFFYKPQYDDGSHLLQYGLIAEEVAKVYPEMVAYDNDGQLLTVKYQLLAPILLNEVQKQNAQDPEPGGSHSDPAAGESETRRPPCRRGGVAVKPEIDSHATGEWPVRANLRYPATLSAAKPVAIRIDAVAHWKAMVYRSNPAVWEQGPLCPPGWSPTNGAPYSRHNLVQSAEVQKPAAMACPRSRESRTLVANPVGSGAGGGSAALFAQ
jgi:hypothetical protein